MSIYVHASDIMWHPYRRVWIWFTIGEANGIHAMIYESVRKSGTEVSFQLIQQVCHPTHTLDNHHKDNFTHLVIIDGIDLAALAVTFK